ncbi:NUDIX domain-containing protein [Microdochium trichocladiopsis]|uniref:NUDIX domain-containing protein n=1 Tax=Microdochium trichocladiopsis TaxID=1682393 RepID=A0A9P8YE13_9PEZI|nr:NUDIX domain-containing protein [Microdochium trichocladiopsis]KAH7037281.1 NUDIX domain-containing protein [Microdochium trichocladiopsis]
MATTFNAQPGNIPVSLADGLSPNTFASFKPFNKWLDQTTRSLALQASNPDHPFHDDPYTLRSVTVQAFDMFGGSRLGFVKMTADVRNGAGESLPGAVFLRGPSVAMLVMLIPEHPASQEGSGSSIPPGAKVSRGPQEKEEEEERYVILTVQPRIAAGSLEFVELPAGMVDDAGTFAGAAAKEIKEELGLEIPASELRCLSDLAAGASSSTGNSAENNQKHVREEGGERDEGLPAAMYPSAGGCDEYIPIYMHERRVPREQLKEWTGKLTGLREHGEKITLKLVRMQDLWKEGGRDAKALAAVALWEGLRRERKL